MHTRSTYQKNLVRADEIVKVPKEPVSRRALLGLGLLGVAATTLAGIDALAWVPLRIADATKSATAFPDIQFDISKFFAPVRTFSGVQVRFGPVYTVFLTARLNHTPTKSDQTVLANALNAIEERFPFSPSGIFTFVAYGLPYFRRLPGGITGSVVSSHMPRLLSDTSRYALEEAVPSPTDVTSGGSITKAKFKVPVVIESNDVLFTLRSDIFSNVQNVISWLQGSNSLNGSSVASPAFNGLFTFTSMRTMFTQMSLPHSVAQKNNLPYARYINPDSPMWMGFADQQVAASGPAAITTFQGNSSARFTDASSSSYFANGSIQHLSHVIQDLGAFYKVPDEPFTERVQYMFRSDPIPALGNGDQFSNGGGPAFLANDASVFLRYRAQGVTEASQTARDLGDGLNVVNDPEPATSPDADDVGKRRPRMGHLPALQQSSRAADGTPIHIRMDGPGFDDMDVPDGSNQPKLQFTVFVPTAEFFRVMRVNQAALRFQAPQDASGNVTGPGVHADDNGIDRFLTATRRQNFLIPPRAHRAFPLLELTQSQVRQSGDHQQGSNSTKDDQVQGKTGTLRVSGSIEVQRRGSDARKSRRSGG